MRSLDFSPEAAKDFKRVISFLHDLNPRAALRLSTTLKTAIENLRVSSELGRPYFAGRNIREIIIPFAATAYIVRYQIRDETILIVRVWSGREDRP